MNLFILQNLYEFFFLIKEAVFSWNENFEILVSKYSE